MKPQSLYNLTTSQTLSLVENITGVIMETKCDGSATVFSLYSQSSAIKRFTKNQFIFIQTAKMKSVIQFDLGHIVAEDYQFCIKLSLCEKVLTLESYLNAVVQLYKALK